MTPRSKGHDPHAELAALADGTLTGRRRNELAREVSTSPDMQKLLAEQQQAVSLFRAVEIAAPTGLRASLASSGARVGVKRSARRPRLTAPRLSLAAGTALAAAVIAAVVLVVGGTSGAPTVASAAEFGQQPPSAPAPPPKPTEPKLLTADVSGVPFPNWRAKFGWKASGQRVDHKNGRTLRTVYYEKKGKELAYTIVSGKALDVPAGGTPAVREGTRLQFFRRLAGRPGVVWLRGGHTCILSGTGVPRSTMLKLAGWKGKGAVPF